MNEDSQATPEQQQPEHQPPPAGGPQFSPEQAALAAGVRDLLGDDLLSSGLDAGGALVLEVTAARVLDLLGWLSTAAEPPVGYLSDLHGLDSEETMAVVYHLFRRGEAFEVTVKAITPRATPRVPSVTPLWPGARWPEREVMEMFGIAILDHPDPRKLLLPDDWEGHPLRKDYAYPADHPYLAPDPLHEDPATAFGHAGEQPGPEDAGG